MCSYGCSATVYLWIFRWSTGEAASGGSSWQWGSLVKRWPRTQCTTFCSTQEVKEATFTRIMTNAFRSEGHKCGGRSCCWTFQQDLQGWSCFCGYHFETKYVLNTGFVGGEPEGKLRGGRIATMAVSIDIKKELELKLYPTYADRWGLLLCGIKRNLLHTVMRVWWGAQDWERIVQISVSRWPRRLRSARLDFS